MSDKTDANVRSGAAPFLGPDEQVIAVLIASRRGHQQAMSGGIAGMVGGGRAKNAQQEAEAAGVRLAPFMALVLTPGRLLLLETGNAGKVKGLLGEFPLSSVGAMEVKRLGLGGSVTLTIAGAGIRLESRVGASRQFADDLARVKGQAA